MDRRSFLSGLAGGAVVGGLGGFGVSFLVNSFVFNSAASAVPTLTTIYESGDLSAVNAQGVAYDGTYYYTNDGSRGFAGSALKKFTRSGNTYTQVASADILSGVSTDIKQVNSVVYFGGSLWLGASNFLTGSETPAASWVVEVDPSDLSIVDTYALEDAAFGEGGAWKDVGSGDEFWVVFHDTNLVARYQLSAGAMVKQDEYTLPLIPAAEGSGSLNQGAQWYGNELWTQLHNQHSETGTYIHRWTGSGFAGVGFIPPLGSPDEAGQGLHWETVGEVMLFAIRGTNATRILRASVGDLVTGRVLLSGDEQSGTDAILLSGDEQSGSDSLLFQELPYA